MRVTNSELLRDLALHLGAIRDDQYNQDKLEAPECGCALSWCFHISNGVPSILSSAEWLYAFGRVGLVRDSAEQLGLQTFTMDRDGAILRLNALADYLETNDTHN